MSKLELSYSKCTTFLRCRKEYDWIYHEDLAPIAKDVPLQVGDITHWLREMYANNKLDADIIQALPDYIQESYPANERDLSVDVALEAGTLMLHYAQYMQDSEYEIVSPEMHLEKDFGDFILYSRLDGLMKDRKGRMWRDELKTAGRMDSHYLQGYRKGLQTAIAHWLMEELLDFDNKGTIFELLVKTRIPQIHQVPVSKEQWRIDYGKEVVYGIVRSIQRGDFYPTLACSRYNRSCPYEILCRNDTPENRKAFYTSRSAEKERKTKLRR